MGAKILVVEDDQPTARLISKVLSLESGYKVEVASDGSSALKIAADWVPDLILLDVMLPSMDGFEVCRRMREIVQVASVPILMVTALTSMDDVRKGFEAGANDYIAKPFDPYRLALQVSAYLDLMEMASKHRVRIRSALLVTGILIALVVGLAVLLLMK